MFNLIAMVDVIFFDQGFYRKLNGAILNSSLMLENAAKVSV
jgi:hypothetical protein